MTTQSTLHKMTFTPVWHSSRILLLLLKSL
nr:MAG TPA: hypothetical protein [Bacteriophage sp.]